MSSHLKEGGLLTAVLCRVPATTDLPLYSSPQSCSTCVPRVVSTASISSLSDTMCHRCIRPLHPVGCYKVLVIFLLQRTLCLEGGFRSCLSELPNLVALLETHNTSSKGGGRTRVAVILQTVMFALPHKQQPPKTQTLHEQTSNQQQKKRENAQWNDDFSTSRNGATLSSQPSQTTPHEQWHERSPLEGHRIQVGMLRNPVQCFEQSQKQHTWHFNESLGCHDSQCFRIQFGALK